MGSSCSDIGSELRSIGVGPEGPALEARTYFVLLELAAVVTSLKKYWSSLSASSSRFEDIGSAF